MKVKVTMFRFDQNLPNVGKADFIAEVPSGLQEKKQLLRVLVQILCLPDYFGNNWDALDECLRDLHWIKNRRVVIAHHDLPQLGDHDTRVYLQILSDALKSWATEGGDHELIVSFPYSDRGAITKLLDEQ